MQTGNRLFPIFLKLENLDTLLVGGGNVGLEKLSALLKNSPEAKITVVAPLILEEVKVLAAEHPQVSLVYRKFEWDDLLEKDVVVLATDDSKLHEDIKKETRKRRILTNVADTPHLCDFYLGSVIQKGDLKIAVSTNGKSPTLAKRMREFLESMLPDTMQDLLDNLYAFRSQIQGDFQKKVAVLNELTASMIPDKDKNQSAE